MTEQGITPPAYSTYPDVETAMWQNDDVRLVLIINHLREPLEGVAFRLAAK
jgi:hypothetical protein